MHEFKPLHVTARYTIKQLIDQHEDIEENIQSIGSVANTHDICQGIAWYQIAHTIADNIAKEHDRSLTTVAGIIAALSPGCQWTKNIIDTIAVLEHGSNAIVSTYNLNKGKATSIYTGGKVDNILGGNKTRSFYQNILLPDDDNHITIDRHAIRAGCDWYQQYNSNKFAKDNKYFILENAYFAIARKQQLLGHQTQAIAWLTYKRLFGKMKDDIIRLPSYVFTENDQWDNNVNYLSVLDQLKTANDNIATQISLY